MRSFVSLENGIMPTEEWVELQFDWDCALEYTMVSINGTCVGSMPKLEQGNGLSYVRVFAAEIGEGIQVGSMSSMFKTVKDVVQP